MNRRYVYEELPALPWYMLWLNFKCRLFNKPVVSSYVEVPKHLPCGCENPDYGKATHEETAIFGRAPFDILANRVSPIK